MSSFVQLLLKSLRSLVSDTDPLAALAASASSIHAQAWGRKWPHSYQGTIRLSDLKPCPPTTLGEAVVQAVERFEPLDDDLEEENCVFNILGEVQTDALTYDYLTGMKDVARRLDAVAMLQDCLVVRKEYFFLIEELEKLAIKPNRAVAILGQPGIGVSTFSTTDPLD